MVRKYNPEIQTKYWEYESEPDISAVMEEVRDGEYVKLQTYEDETARLRAMVARKQNRIEEMEVEIAVGKDIMLSLVNMLQKENNHVQN